MRAADRNSASSSVMSEGITVTADMSGTEGGKEPSTYDVRTGWGWEGGEGYPKADAVRKFS